MEPHSNLNKLRRLSQTLEIKGRYSTLDPDRFSEAVKLPALNSINRSVKYNDISFSFSKDLNKLRKQPEADISLFETVAHTSLVTVRRRYDNLSKERQTLEYHIKELEHERDKALTEKQKFQGKKMEGNKKVKEMQQQLERVRTLCEENEMEKKIMTHMMDRLKHDKIVYDQQKFNREKELTLIARHKEFILKENASLRESEDKSKKVYQKMVEHVELELQERQTHINSMQYMIDSKVSSYEWSVTKKAQTKEVAQNALSQKDQKEKNWYKVYLCHRFVEKMLRDKIDREMHKFSPVEQAFKYIKTATGVSTGEALVSKFLNKENDYGDLLGKITNEQNQILQIKAEMEQLNKEQRKLRAEQDNLSVSKKGESDLTNQQKQFNFVSQKASCCYLFQETLKLWLERNLKKFKKISEHAELAHSHQNIGEVVASFKNYLNILKESAEQIAQIKVEEEEVTEAVSLQNNLRIKLQNDPQHQKPQKNQKETNTQTNEDDFVNELRLETLRNHDKFMKELKKKHDQIKKQKIEGEPKKKEPQVEKPIRQPPSSQNS